MDQQPSDESEKWYRWAYEHGYGKESIDTETGADKSRIPANLVPYEPDIKKYWDEDKPLAQIMLTFITFHLKSVFGNS